MRVLVGFRLHRLHRFPVQPMETKPAQSNGPQPKGIVMETFRIVRRYRDTGRALTMARGLTLEGAQAWCRNPETSSSTCTKPANVRRTKRCGPWFDGYEKE